MRNAHADTMCILASGQVNWKSDMCAERTLRLLRQISRNVFHRPVAAAVLFTATVICPFHAGSAPPPGAYLGAFSGDGCSADAPDWSSPKGAIAEVVGHDRLYLHSDYPPDCASSKEPCSSNKYVIPGDTVRMGQSCGTWSDVQYVGKKSVSWGWVQSDRLKPIGPAESMVNMASSVLLANIIGSWYSDHNPQEPDLVIESSAISYGMPSPNNRCVNMPYKLIDYDGDYYLLQVSLPKGQCAPEGWPEKALLGFFAPDSAGKDTRTLSVLECRSLDDWRKSKNKIASCDSYMLNSR